jgi:hypothetical protein
MTAEVVILNPRNGNFAKKLAPAACTTVSGSPL